MADTSINDILTRLRARAEAAGVRVLTLPPVTPARLRSIQLDMLGLPTEIAELLALTAGLQFGEHALDFAASFHVTETPPPPESPWRLFPRRLDLGTGSDGGRYIVDLSQPAVATAPVFGVWPDPPVIKLLTPSLEAFLANVARAMPAKGDGSVWDFAPLGGGYKPGNRRAASQFEPAPVLRGTQLRRLADAVLTAYIQHLPAGGRLVDLRGLKPGAGFEWAGRWQIAEFQRHPSELIFGLTIRRRWWRPTAVLLGRPSAREKRRWKAAFRLE